MKITISILQSRKLINILFILFLSYLSSAYSLAGAGQQQEFQLTGTVVDATTNEPLPGVTILVKGTSIGTVSDIDGKFSLNVSQGMTLQFNFIGYLKEEVAVSTETELNISLVQDIIGLDEVVVTGYGVQKKSDLTGAIASVSSEKLDKTPVTGLDQALQGMAAGVDITPVTGRPGGGVNIAIRGISSINGTQPKIIVDGVSQDEYALGRINPDDVESIEVLKDASSAAIYGASGGNGVIIVTTKKGKSGKLKVNYDAYVGQEQVIKKLDLMNTEQWMEVIDENSTSQTPFSTRPDTFENYDWQDIMFKKAITQNHNISISGGNEKSRFMFSAGYTKQEGIIGNTDNQRLTLRLNSDHTINKYITFEEKVSYVNNVRQGFADWEYAGYYQNPVMPALQMTPYLPAYNPDYQPTWGDSGVWTVPYGGGTNPVAMIDLKDNTIRNNNFEGNFSVIITPFKGLSYTARYTRGINFDDEQEYKKPYWASPTSLLNDNSLKKTIRKGQSWNIQNIITYNTTLFGAHNITIMAG